MSVRSRSKKAAACRAAGLDSVFVDAQDPGVALASAGADRRAPDAAAAPAQLVHQRAEDAGAGRPDGVTERNRTAIDVDLVLVDAQQANRVQRDRRERLVDLPE